MVKNQLFAPVTRNTMVAPRAKTTVKIEDKEKPLNFKQWLYRSHSIKKGFEYEEYNNYLAKWNKLQTTRTTTADKIKADYISFIKSLSLFFDEDMRKKFNNDFELDNLLNLEQIIPYCAEKLRDIMVYYQNKREAIKRAKLKYNLVGTETAIERLLHDYILRAFTKHGSYIKINDHRLYEALPGLYTVNNSLEIKIDELYDDTEYMDKNPEKEADFYFGEPSDEALKFYKENGYNEKEVNWLLGNGFMGVVGENPIAEVADVSVYELQDLIQKLQEAIITRDQTADLPVSAFVDYDKTNTIEYYQKQLTKKYLGEDQYVLNGGYYIDKHLDLDYDLYPGNNWISFPSGEGDFERVTTKIKPIYLSACSLIENEEAIGASSYYDADKIFLSYGNFVEGAWLKDISKDFTPDTMVCNIYANKPYQFRFPYCDYGVSGEGIEWSGPGINNTDMTLYTLPKQDRDAILFAYWSKQAEYTIRPIDLNKTTLIECGANADTYFNKADRITVREGVEIHDSNPNGVYTGEKREAFLYKVLSSDVPVRTGRNYIQWPYQNKTVDGPLDLPKGGCEDVCISAEAWRKIAGSRAGYDLFDSDIIYKLDAPDGNPIECAFLQGVPFTDLSAAGAYDPTGAYDDWNPTTWTAAATGCFQVGRYTKCLANSFVTFIWLDEDTPMDDVVFHIDHHPDCPYLAEKKYSLFENNPDTNNEEETGITFKEWHKCTCGAIKYSPFGHPGKKFEDFNGYADCCFVDNTYPLPFDKNIWFGDDVDKDGANRNYLTSEDFGWYQLTGKNQVEPDIGWGEGHWIAGAEGDGRNKFILKKGKQYKYFRTGIGHSDANIISGTIAPLIITHKHSNRVMNFARPRWMKAVMDSDGNWLPTDEASHMVIKADDNIVYDHIETEWWCITGNKQVTKVVETNDIEPSISAEDYLNFVDYNVVPVSSYVVSAQWPAVSPLKGWSGGSYTHIPLRGDIEIVEWTVDYRGVGLDGDPVTYHYSVNEPISFAATEEGDISVTAEGYTNLNSTSTGITFDENYTKIPNAKATFKIHFKAPVTAEMEYVTHDVYTVSADTIGFPLNIPLDGWDYDKRDWATSATFASANGARPFWASASNIDDAITHQKAIDKWGGGLRLVDDYIPIMQPPASDITLSGFACLSYETTNPFCWTQPIEFNKKLRDRRWCKLTIDPNKVHTLSGELAKKDFKEIVAVATDETSDIMLEATKDGNEVTVNYWANNAFEWHETAIDITDGVAPTGGEFVPDQYTLYSDANSEYANLSNRHFPTIAVAPVIDNLYMKEDVGGYVIPQHLGASVALSRNTRTKIDIESRTSADDGKLINDRGTYATDYGLSNTLMNDALLFDEDDVGWMKSPMVNGINAGFIKNSMHNQQFMSYQSVTENRNGFNDIGVVRFGDITDPWTGEQDVTWRKNMYDRHFTGQVPIEYVRNSYIITDKIKTWTHDIYGYSYGILKEDDKESPYKSKINRERFTTGKIYIRRNDGAIDDLSKHILTSLQDKIRDDEFYAIDMCFDVLILIGTRRVIFYKLVYDEEKEGGFKIVDDTSNANIINFSNNFMNEFTDLDASGVKVNVRCAGVWLYPADSKIDAIYLTWYNIDGTNHYYCIIDTMDTNTFVHRHIKYGESENGNLPITLESLNPEDDSQIFDFDRYTMIGPIISHVDGLYTVVFQMRGDASTNDKIGRFVRASIRPASKYSHWEMVKKIDFYPDEP